MASPQDADPPSAFLAAYRLVKMAALYAGTFFGCYYWPLFLAALLGGHGDPRSQLVAGALIAPLGFLILGIALGKRMALTHVVLLLIGAGAASIGFTQLMGDQEELPRLVAVWTPVIILVFLAGFVAGLRRELRLPL